MIRKSIISALLLAMTLTKATAQETSSPVLPRPNQLLWQQSGIGAVFHYDLHVFDGVRYSQPENRITPVADHNIFSPDELDTDQWIRAAKSAGCRFAILTATHETGFGLWQSDVNPFCLKTVRWRNGRGDIVADFVRSCHKYGLLPGLYIGIRWNSFLGIHNFEASDKTRQAWYKNYCERMVEELCSRYGPLFMIWFDGGADDPDGLGPDIEPIINRLQPECLFYHNARRADLRWGGTESGEAAYPCWSTFPYPYSHGKDTETNPRHTELLRHGDPDGRYWMPAMADTPLRGANGRHEWFWEPDDENAVHPLDKLIEIYEKTVGRNSVLVLGLTPDPRGLIPETDEHRLRELGEEIDRRYGHPAATTSGRGETLILELKEMQTIDRCMIGEDITHGERIRHYTIEAHTADGWTVLCEGRSVGSKRIECFSPVMTDKLRLTVTEAVSEPEIASFSVFRTENDTFSTKPSSYSAL